VGQKKPNGLGIYDLSGNAAEVVTIRREVKTSQEKLSKKAKRRRKRRKRGQPIKPLYDYFSVDGDWHHDSEGRPLNTMFKTRKKLSGSFNNYHTYVGVRLVKDVPRWKGRYIDVFGGEITVGENYSIVTTDSFKICTTDITNIAYAQFLNFDRAFPETYRLTKWIDLKGNSGDQKCRIYYKNGRYEVEPGYEKNAVTFVSHLGARAYALWRGGRLPSEVELAQVQKQGKLNNRQVALWCADQYQEGFLESLQVRQKNPVNTTVTGQHVVNDLQANRKGYFSNNFYPNVGFRVVLPKE